jgi:hypothetical protein
MGVILPHFLRLTSSGVITIFVRETGQKNHRSQLVTNGLAGPSFRVSLKYLARIYAWDRLGLEETIHGWYPAFRCEAEAQAT